MIIIEKTAGLEPGQIRERVLRDCMFIAGNRVDFWIHKEAEGREIALNTDDDPIRPGMLAYQNYEEGCVPVQEWRDQKGLELWTSICDEIGL